MLIIDCSVFSKILVVYFLAIVDEEQHNPCATLLMTCLGSDSASEYIAAAACPFLHIHSSWSRREECKKLAPIAHDVHGKPRRSIVSLLPRVPPS